MAFVVMVVEDDAIIGLDIEQRVRHLGYEVCGVADSGEEALLMAEEKHPDLVLMDIQLRGDMDGIETAHELKKRSSLPVVFITAYSDTKMRERALAAEPSGYIVKPIRDTELKRTLAEVAEKKG